MTSETASVFPAHVNLCLFGLNRSLSLTIASLRRHVLLPLAECGVSVHLFACFVKASAPIVNARTGEIQVVPESSELELLPEACIRYVDQETIDAMVDWEAILAPGDCFGDSHLDGPGSPSGSVCNAIRALSSLCIVHEMLPEENLGWPVVFLRPDIDLLAPLAWPSIFAALSTRPTANAYGLARGVAVVPSWHRWDGVNDRFAVCSAGEAAYAYARRVKFLHDYLRVSAMPFHPESFLLHVLTLRHIQPFPIIDAPMVRIRCEGKIHPEPFAEGSQQLIYPAAAWQGLLKQHQETSAKLAAAEKTRLQHAALAQERELERDAARREVERLSVRESELAAELEEARAGCCRLEERERELGQSRAEVERLGIRESELAAELDEARAGCRRLEERERELVQSRAEVERLRGLEGELLALQEQWTSYEASWQELNIARAEPQPSSQTLRELDDLRTENEILLEELCCAQERLEQCLQLLEGRPEPADVLPAASAQPEDPSFPAVADTVTINLNRSRLLASV